MDRVAVDRDDGDLLVVMTEIEGECKYYSKSKMFTDAESKTYVCTYRMASPKNGPAHTTCL